MSINTRNTTPITINDLPVDSVEDFTYLGSIISKDNGIGSVEKSRKEKRKMIFTFVDVSIRQCNL